MRPDDDIKRDVEAELRWEPDLDPTDIAVTVKDGVVTLSGFVKGFGQRRRAEAAAKRVAGVRGVADDIEVRLPIIHRRPDPEIAREAVEELSRWLPASHERIKVTVEDGFVTLEGEVEWQYQREAAEQAVSWLRGVRAVSNLIQLKPKATTGEIKRTIEDAFKRSAEIDAGRISVDVHGGEVVLSGTVRSWADRREAERAAWAVPGVSKVENRIRIEP